jgi:hypothetical protein
MSLLAEPSFGGATAGNAPPPCRPLAWWLAHRTDFVLLFFEVFLN